MANQRDLALECLHSKKLDCYSGVPEVAAPIRQLVS
jgi:hypothetical protein